MLFVLTVLPLYSISALVTQAKRENNLPNNAVPHSDIAGLERPWQTNSLCGPNALFLLAKLHGKQIRYSDIRDAITIDPERGCSFADLLRVSNRFKLGFVSRKIRFDDLAQIPTPFIAHLRRDELKQASGHFVVVAEIASKDGRIYAYDPISEFRNNYDKADFHRAMSGYILCSNQRSDYTALLVAVGVFVNIFLGLKLWSKRTK